MSVPGNKKWKDALLKTSLPLEHLIAEKLGKHGFLIHGEYSFIRDDEQGVDTEFSVDLRASELLDRGEEDYWADLNLLVECKYNYPGVRWIFAPHPEESEFAIGVVNVLQQLCTRRITDTSPVYDIDQELPYCVKGIELHESDANTQSITRGLYQLKYAVMELASNIIYRQITTWNDVDLHIGIVCPILVTTASLHVLKDGLTLEQFQNASNLNDVAEQVDALVVFQENRPQLSKYIRKVIADLYRLSPEIKTRLEELEAVEGKPEYRSALPVNWLFDSILKSYAERVLVITYEAFEQTVLDIRNSVLESGKSLSQVAILKKDMTKRKKWVEALPKTE